MNVFEKCQSCGKELIYDKFKTLQIAICDCGDTYSYTAKDFEEWEERKVKTLKRDNKFRLYVYFDHPVYSRIKSMREFCKIPIEELVENGCEMYLKKIEKEQNKKFNAVNLSSISMDKRLSSKVVKEKFDLTEHELRSFRSYYGLPFMWKADSIFYDSDLLKKWMAKNAHIVNTYRQHVRRK